MMFRDRFDDEDDEPKDPEFTLGIGSLLGIFFGLVLLCGLFFGFGYSLGHGRSPLHVTHPSAGTPETPPAGTTSSLSPNGTKPAAQQGTPPPAPADPNSGQSKSAQPPNGTTPASAATPNGTQQAAQQPTTAPQQGKVPQQSDTITPPSALRQTATPGTAQQYMVQVAAVRRPQDASVLVSALRQRGFHAISRSQSPDHLLHVQIGPFATLAAANQMRSRLKADGYNAILKP